MTGENGKRRWRQFRLRTLLIAVLVLSLPLGWLSWRLKQAADQRRSVGAFRDAGGFVHYDYGPEYERDLFNSPELGGPGPAPQPPWPKWLRDLVGDDFLFGIKQVNLSSPEIPDDRITDELLVNLTGIRGPRKLWIHSSRVTDEGLRILPELPTIRHLVLDTANVTDAGLSHLSQLRMLEQLSLYTPNVTDAGLGNLSELRMLQHLNLGTSNVTDAGLAHLEPLKQLKSLSLRGTKVTGAGVAKLRQSLPDTRILYKFDTSGRADRAGRPSTTPIAQIEPLDTEALKAPN